MTNAHHRLKRRDFAKVGGNQLVAIEEIVVMVYGVLVPDQVVPVQELIPTENNSNSKHYQNYITNLRRKLYGTHYLIEEYIKNFFAILYSVIVF